jgi:hypothetical protein
MMPKPGAATLPSGIFILQRNSSHGVDRRAALGNRGKWAPSGCDSDTLSRRFSLHLGAHRIVNSDITQFALSQSRLYQGAQLLL